EHALCDLRHRAAPKSQGLGCRHGRVRTWNRLSGSGRTDDVQQVGGARPAAAHTPKREPVTSDPTSAPFSSDTAGGPLAALIANNRRYAETFSLGGFDGIAKAGVAIVTCMDSRIEPLAMVGLTHGDAKIFRNPGGRITDAALEALVL